MGVKKENSTNPEAAVRESWATFERVALEKGNATSIEAAFREVVAACERVAPELIPKELKKKKEAR